MQTTIVLRTKPSRLGNSKKLAIHLQDNRITGVTENPAGLRGACLEIKVAPTEINELVKVAKRNGLYS